MQNFSLTVQCVLANFTLMGKNIQIKSNQIKSNQIKSNQIKSNQIKSNQIKSVPEKIHEQLKQKAALSGKALTDYLLEELVIIAERPTFVELGQRIKSRKPVRTKMSPTKVLRGERIKA